MARRTVHHMDFETLVDINKAVVSLTGEPHGYAPADQKKLEELVKEVEHRADNQELSEAVSDKAALLIFKLASGQYFRAGNKRTALVAGLVFLTKNGYKLDITDADLISTVDKAGIAAASLDDLYDLLRRLTSRSKSDRRGWDKIVGSTVEGSKEFLTKLGA